MVLDYFGQPRSHDELVELCRAKPGVGTENQALALAIASHGLCAHMQQHTSLEHLKEIFEAKRLVVVNYFNPISRVGHFAVVQGFDEDAILLADPKNGEDYRIPLNEFEQLWHNHNKTLLQWMVVIADPQECDYGHCASRL
jgi:ABC-type bacteriocin/lantibiotic exporter with double-glycine peptidase domain